MAQTLEIKRKFLFTYPSGGVGAKTLEMHNEEIIIYRGNFDLPTPSGGSVAKTLEMHNEDFWMCSHPDLLACLCVCVCVCVHGCAGTQNIDGEHRPCQKSRFTFPRGMRFTFPRGMYACTHILRPN